MTQTWFPLLRKVQQVRKDTGPKCQVVKSENVVSTLGYK